MSRNREDKMRAKVTVSVLFGALLATTHPAAPKEVVTMVHPHDPIFEMSMWPILNGKVKSDKVEFKVTFTSIPAVIQAASTKQYDLVPMVTQAIPRLVERGLPFKVLATNQRYQFSGGGSHLYVAANGPIKSVADLKGKTIGVTSLNSSGVTATRIVLQSKYNANVALDGGDFRWVEMPLAVLPTAVQSGRVDAAILSNQQDYQALHNKNEFRVLIPEGLKDALGVAVPTTMVIGFDDKLKARPEIFVEAARMLRESSEYFMKNQDEVFSASAKDSGDVAYMKWYIANYASIPYDLTKEDFKGMGTLWDAAKKLQIVKEAPQVKDVIWERAVVK